MSRWYFPDENLARQRSKIFFLFISPVIQVHSGPSSRPEISQSHVGGCLPCVTDVSGTKTSERRRLFNPVDKRAFHCRLMQLLPDPPRSWEAGQLFHLQSSLVLLPKVSMFIVKAVKSDLLVTKSRCCSDPRKMCVLFSMTHPVCQ